MKLRSDHKIAAATLVLAIGVPIGAAIWVDRSTDDLATHLGAAGGVTARIGKVDADLTGTIHLRDVALGGIVAADEIEASVALDSLLDGQVSADEIRVAGPHLAIAVDRDGDSDLARLVRKLAHAGPRKGGAARSRVRRIVVSSGTLTARIAGIGELAADSVELVPDAGGVRVITGPLRIRGAGGPLHGELVMARSAAELSLPHARFGRVLGVAGNGTLTIGDRQIAVRDVAIGRLTAGGNLDVRGFLDDGGAQRSISAEVAHSDTGFAFTVRGERIPLAPLGPLVPRGIVLANARASGELTFRRTKDTIQLAVAGSVAGLLLDHKTIAPQPVPVDGKLDASLTVSPAAIAVDHASVTLGAAAWTASGWLRRGSPISGQLDLRLAAAPCMDLVHSIPVELRGPLDGIAMTGTFGAGARLSIDLAAPAGDGVQLDTSMENACTVTAEPPAADVTTLATVSDHTFPDGSHARVGKGEPAWFELKRLHSYVYGAFVSAEDGRFFAHPGFDTTQIARSFEIDLRDRKLARGGSTISQQLIKNAFLTQRRSLDRKVQEALLTWRLEARLGKETILERYLNIIELGPHMFGIRAAAQYWFNKSPRELSVHEAAFLAALTSEPTTMTKRIRRAGTLDPDSAARVDIILRAMRRDGVISVEELNAARENPLWFAASALRRES